MSHNSPYIGFEVKSLLDFEDRHLARRVVGEILTAPGFPPPKKYGRSEPLKEKLNPDDLDPLVDLWVGRGTDEWRVGELLLGSGSEAFLMVDWQKGPDPLIPSISGDIPVAELKKGAERADQFLQLLKRLVTIVDSIYARVANMSFPGWYYATDLKTRLPDVSWLTIFGQPYIKMFGKKRILTAPCHRIEELPSGHILLQATESVFKPVPEKIRAAIRQHLGEEAFMSHGRWNYSTGKHPRFDFSNLAVRSKQKKPRREVVKMDTESRARPVKLTPRLEKRVAKLAELCRETTAETLGIELSYDEASICLIDDVILKAWPKGASGNAEDMYQIWGSFLGEAMRSALGGEWVEAEGTVGVKLGTIVTYPFSKIQKRFENGLEDSIAFYYKALKKALAESKGN